MRLVLSDDGKMSILDRTVDTAEQTMFTAVRLDPDKTYTNADFSGERYFLRYTHSGPYTACSGISTPDGMGNFTAISTCNVDGSVLSSSGGGTYSVNPDGSLTFIESNITGYLTGDGKILVNGHVNTPWVWSISTSLKKTGQTL